jgi:hypothetical protein
LNHPEASAVREVIVWREVHNALWQKLSKEHYEKVRDRLIDQLERRYDHWRTQRHPEDDTLFVYRIFLAEGDNWHEFEFHVDDTHLFVVDVIHTLGKIRLR